MDTWLTLGRHSINQQLNQPLNIDKYSVETWSSINQLKYINWNLMVCQSAKMICSWLWSILCSCRLRCQSNVNWGVDQVLPEQNFYRDLTKIVEILPWCLWDSKSRQDRSEISSISPRWPRSCRDCRDLTKISPWCLWVSESRRDCGKMEESSPRSPHNVCGFLKSRQVYAEIFHISLRLGRSHRKARLFLYLGKISLRSCQDFERHKPLTEIANILPRSRQNCHHLTHLSPALPGGWPRGTPGHLHQDICKFHLPRAYILLQKTTTVPSSGA